MHPHITTPLCQCGCAQRVILPTAKFLRGHHWKTQPPETRFWPNVEKTDSCWHWTGQSSGKLGYGRIAWARSFVLAHRVSWEIHHGPIPAGLFVCHRCDTPSCVRPDHLFLGTPADNTRDMLAKGRHHASHAPRLAGEAHPQARLTQADVAEIRRQRANNVPLGVIAAAFHISKGHVCRIVLGHVWRKSSVT